jgi:hypothetical protein
LVKNVGERGSKRHGMVNLRGHKKVAIGTTENPNYRIRKFGGETWDYRLGKKYLRMHS